jgi:acetyl-CoA carboxylase carboxyl transferase subunit beta
VIEQTIREKLPGGFQRAEYLRAHGMVDMVVHRHELRPTLSNLCRLLVKAPPLVPQPRLEQAFDEETAPTRAPAEAGMAPADT